jgi:hypothetical protein
MVALGLGAVFSIILSQLAFRLISHELTYSVDKLTVTISLAMRPVVRLPFLRLRTLNYVFTAVDSAKLRIMRKSYRLNYCLSKRPDQAPE